VSDALELIYVGDAMCSWCWGFAPTIGALQERTGLPVRLVNGGLRPGDAAEALDPAMVTFLEGCWTQVHAASGQPFDHAGLNKPEGWRYDTEPPARALVTMRALKPDAELALYHRLQRAFYAEGVDITDPEQWRPLLAEFDVDVDEFLETASHDKSREVAWADFALARGWGISGFPALLLRDGDELSLVTRGWSPAEPLVDAVVAWLADRTGDSVQGEACAVDGSGC